jgi:hypothetical protein
MLTSWWLSSWWFGILLGFGIVAAGSALRSVSHMQAMQAESVSKAMQATVRGMLWRGAFILTGFILTLLLLPVHTVAFTGALMGALTLSMIVEVTVVWKRMDRTQA